MTFRECRLVTLLVSLGVAPLAAQTPSRLDAGGGAGGSVFGWQPRVVINADLQAASLGPVRALLRGALGRVAAPAARQYELFGGARLASAAVPMGLWLGYEAVRRNGFSDAVEQPRVETGGWHRVGNLVITISAVRRRAAVSGTTHFTRSVTSYYSYLDSTTGHWDSTRVVRTVTDSARRSDMQRWAETQAAVAWQGQRFSAGLAMGGRLPSRGVPRGAWASGDLAVRLATPLSLVIGGGSSTGGRFALDAEHRYVTLGFRISPHLTSGPLMTHATPAASAGRFVVESIGAGRYRITLGAPRAHRVELSSDFTGWKAVALEGGDNGLWTLTVPLAPGTHRLNVRVDGGSWMVPPGLTAVSDDFAGEVGVLVIEREDVTK